NYKNPNKRALSISLAFYDIYDRFLFACRSDVIDKRFSETGGVATLIVEKWPTSNGVYTYNTSIHDQTSVVENLRNVGQLTVDVGDFYGFGKLPASGKQGFYTNYKWI